MCYSNAGLISVLHMSMGLHLQVQNAHRHPRSRSNVSASQQKQHAGKPQGQHRYTDVPALLQATSSCALTQCSDAVGMTLQRLCHKGVRC